MKRVSLPDRRDPLYLYINSLLYERIPESASVYYVQSYRGGKQKCAYDDRNDIRRSERAGHIPCPFFPLAEPPKLHSVGYDLYPVHTGQYERYEDGACALQALHDVLFPAHLDAPSLLGLGYLVIALLDIRYVAEREGNRVGYRVFYSDPVQ